MCHVITSSYNHFIIMRTHRWPYGPCFSLLEYVRHAFALAFALALALALALVITLALAVSPSLTKIIE